jgi:hypothetical protein
MVKKKSDDFTSFKLLKRNKVYLSVLIYRVLFIFFISNSSEIVDYILWRFDSKLNEARYLVDSLSGPVVLANYWI